MAPAEVERSRIGGTAMLEEQTDPRDPTDEQVRPQHAPQVPILQVLSLHRWIEHDPSSALREAHPELDVLDRMLDESSTGLERVAPDGPQAGPERARGPGGALMDVMVEQVTENRDD